MSLFSGRYPRLGSVQDNRPKWEARGDLKRPKCCACPAPADATVWVEVDGFRGNDERAPTCWKHRDDLAAIVKSGALKG